MRCLQATRKVGPSLKTRLKERFCWHRWNREYHHALNYRECRRCGRPEVYDRDWSTFDSPTGWSKWHWVRGEA